MKGFYVTDYIATPKFSAVSNFFLTKTEKLYFQMFVLHEWDSQEMSACMENIHF